MIARVERFFPRRRLFARLDEVLVAPLAIVAATAESGKSTAVRAYLDERAVRCVRYDVVPEHGSVPEFVRGLALALEEVVPALRSSLASALERHRAGADDGELSAWTIEHLRDLEVTLVVDGLHHALVEPAIARIVRDLVDATVPHVRWVLITRDASSLPVARWLANGTMRLPIDDDDLRVGLDDLRATAASLGLRLANADLEALYRQTKGYPLELSLALKNGARPPGDEEERDAFYRATVAGALGARDLAAQNRLLSAALASPIDGAIIAALGYDDVELIEELSAAGFVYAGGADAYAWYDAYRFIFLEELERCDVQRRNALLESVAAALELVGRWEESVALRIRAGNSVGLAASLDRRGLQALDRGESAIVRRALDVLPDAALSGYPTALALKAVLASLDERFDLSEAWFRMAIEASAGLTRREIVVRYGLDLVRRGRRDAVDLLERESANVLTGGWDAVLYGLLATAYVSAQRMDDARRAARRALSGLHLVGDDALRARILHQAAYVALNDRDYVSAKDLAERAHRVAEATFLYELAARALSVLYVLAVDVDDDIPAARRHLAGLGECARKAGSVPVRAYGVLALYELETLAGNVEAVAQLDEELQRLELFLTPLASQTLLPARALQASWGGRFDHAYALLAPGAEKLAAHDRRAQRCAETAMYAAAAGLRAEAMKAMRESRRALRHLADGDRWALHSSAYLAVGEVLLGREGRARRALADLRSAARRAGPRFAALVDAIAALSGRWSSEPLSAAALGVALERLEAHDFGGLARFLGALPLPSTDRARIGLLTPVEKEVLRHVAAGATSKEIAATLERSPQTIDVHIRSICKKLGCSGRRQAVAFAIREGLIDELPAL